MVRATALPLFLCTFLAGGCHPLRPPAQRPHVELVAAPPAGDVAAIVRSELVKARDQGRHLVVYVGAKWCEPCQRFHHAAEAGELDQQFPDLRLLTFDEDRDRDRLAQAGYVSEYIPLFALPGADGRATGRQIAGSIKGAGAVVQIAPRLAHLLKQSF